MSLKEDNNKKTEDDRGHTNVNDNNINCSINPQEDELIYLNEDMESIRGDAIGDTMYSERFVLKTLMQLSKITKDLDEEPEIERDLCILWDMTVEADVVNYLLEYDVLEIFGELLNATNDKRLTEILIGILGNMCHVEKVRNQFYTKKLLVLTILLELTGCSDTLTLQQLMRLWSILFRKCPDEHIEQWYKETLHNTNLISNICYILNNVITMNVLTQTIDAILQIIIACDAIESNIIAEIFVKPYIITATMEAFKTLIKNDEWNSDDNDNHMRMFYSNFCNLHARLSDYKQISQEAYKSYNADMLWCLRTVLQYIWQCNSSVTASPSSFKDWDNYEIEIIQSCYDIMKILPDPFDKHISSYLIRFWCMIYRHLGDDELAQDIFSPIMFCISTSNKTTNSENKSGDNKLLNELFDLLNDTDKNTLITYLDQRQQTSGDDKSAQYFDIVKKSY